MGLPLDAVSIAADQQFGREFVEAPWRLETESYESFKKIFQNLGQEDTSRASVADELRRMNIDPEVFYQNAKRVGVQKFSPDDLDPTRVTEASTSDVSTTGMSMAAALLSLSTASEESDHTDRVVEGSASFAPPARTIPDIDGKPAESEDAVAGERCKAIESYHIETDADNLRRMDVPGLPKLNVPELEEVEELPFEEITAEDDERGGRMSHETPRGLSAKLQIDSLTDDEDDEVFNSGGAAQAAQADEQDEIEAFTLDPDFDYDNVNNLTRRI
mmetsp:Transcript_158451/g.279679  ORF Transcript_158451/g.279679 Transcript_158451/m.279679 type:complete len:274 (+) Transcript_158451:77-898(+)